MGWIHIPGAIRRRCVQYEISATQRTEFPVSEMWQVVFDAQHYAASHEPRMRRRKENRLQNVPEEIPAQMEFGATFETCAHDGWLSVWRWWLTSSQHTGLLDEQRLRKYAQYQYRNVWILWSFAINNSIYFCF